MVTLQNTRTFMNERRLSGPSALVRLPVAIRCLNFWHRARWPIAYPQSLLYPAEPGAAQAGCSEESNSESAGLCNELNWVGPLTFYLGFLGFSSPSNFKSCKYVLVEKNIWSVPFENSMKKWISSPHIGWHIYILFCFSFFVVFYCFFLTSK